MKNHFLLIYPPTYTRALDLPIGGLYLCHSLLENNFDVNLINEFGLDQIKTLIQKFTNKNTIAFGLSVVSGRVIDEAIELSQQLKALHPDKAIIWGGPHPSALPEQTLESDLVDYVVVGEGETSLPILLSSLSNGGDFTDIPGLGYKINGQIKVNPPSEFHKLEGISNLPYHLLDMDQYFRKLNIGGDRWLGGMYSRGCPFHCTFCINSNERWPNSILRFHSIDHMIKDIRTLVDRYGADGITLLDDHFFINEKRVVDICKRLEKEKIHIFFRAAGRVDSLCKLHEDTYRLLTDCGFLSIGAGVESGSPRILNEMLEKKITLDQIYIVDELLSKHKINKHWNFITALPGETKEDVKLTLKLIVRLAKTAYDSPFPLSSYKKYIPLPGTKLFFKSIKEYGLKTPERLEDWSKFSMKFELSDEDYDSNVRPWLDQDLLEYTNMGIKLVKELDSMYTGKDADINKINSKIAELQDFISFE